MMRMKRMNSTRTTSTLKRNSASTKTKKMKSKERPEDQIDRFRQAAHERGCDMDEAAFDETLRKMFSPKRGAG